jgi:hypothetical protein
MVRKLSRCARHKITGLCGGSGTKEICFENIYYGDDWENNEKIAQGS